MDATHFSGPVYSANGFAYTSDNSKSVTMEAPDSLAAAYTFVLPPDDGTSGQVLTTDGKGVTTWTTNGAGTVTSVAGTGTVSGISLSGTVTSSGNLTLGGTLSLAAPGAIGGTTPAAGTFTTLTVNDALIGAVQSLSGPGAVNLTDPVTELTTTGADALTLADGTAGQIKVITMIVDGGDGTLTPTTMLGGTTVKFTAVGQGVAMTYTSAGWVVVGNNGATIA